jgi:hypothetical protein
MQTEEFQTAPLSPPQTSSARGGVMLSSAFAAFLALVAFHLSLVATSAPPSVEESAAIDRAISLLDARGFDREVFLLRRTTTFRATDHWLNLFTVKERAFAATNFPFQIITLYPDFYTRATDDTERAMILLHEARHLMAKGEGDAYGYVWQHRAKLGWTQRTHGTTATYVTIEQQTRENAPELFNCPTNLWSDCTDTMQARR